MLTERQKRFAFEYARDGHGTNAALRAGYSENGAGNQASRLLENDEIKALVAEHYETQAYAATLSVAWVLKQWMLIASADPRELTSIELRPCPSCWPADWKEKIPNGCCETCKGEGLRTPVVADTRYLSPAAARLYAGVKITKDGIEVKQRDQDGALMNLAKHLGLLVDRKEVSGPGGGPMQVQGVKPVENLSIEELKQIVANGARAALSDGTLGVDSGVLEGESKATPIESE